MRRISYRFLYGCLPVLLFLVLSSSGSLAQEAALPDHNASANLAAAKRMIEEANSLISEKGRDALIKAESLYQRALASFRKHSDTAGVARALFSLGVTHRDLKQPAEALEYFSQALVALRSLKDDANAARALRNLASILEESGETQKARDHYLEVLKLVSSSGDTMGIGLTLLSLGELESEQSRHGDAASYFERAKTAFREINNLDGVYVASGKLADALISLKRFEDARLSLEDALSIAKKSKEKESEQNIQTKLCETYRNTDIPKRTIECLQKEVASARESRDTVRELRNLESLASALNESNDHAKSAETLKQVIKVARQTQNRLSEAYALFNLGVAFGSLDRSQDSLKSYGEALVVIRELGHRQLEVPILTNQANIYQKVGKRKEAINCFEQALKISREFQNRKQEKLTLISLGMLFHGNDEYEKSLDYFEKALVIAKELNDKENQNFLLIRIGEALYGTKQFDKILAKYLEAFSIAKETGNRYGEAIALERLGAFYISVGRFEKARQHYEQSYKIAVDIKDHSAQGDALLGMADVQFKLGSYDPARHSYEKALALARESKSEYLEATALIGLGLTSRSVSQIEKAREYFEKALDIATRSGEVYRVAQAANELGNTYLDLGKFDKAVEYAERSLTEGRRLSDVERVGYSLVTMMKALSKLKRPETATFYGKQLINLVQDARTKLKVYDADVQQSFLKDKEPFYRDLSDILISQGRLMEAQHVLDLLKEEEFKDVVRRSGDESPKTIPYSELEAAAVEKVERLAILERERSSLEKKGESNHTPEYRKRLSEIYTDFETVNRAFRTSLDALAKSNSGSQQKVLEIQSERNLQRALAQLEKDTGAGVVALYTILGGGSNGAESPGSSATKFGWVILVTPSARKAYPIDVTNIEKTVFDFRRALRSVRTDPRPLAEELYAKLFRQTSDRQETTLENDLRQLFEGHDAKTIMWSLDGILRYVPMAALFDGKFYLIENYRNVLFTRESFLTMTEGPKPRAKAVGLGVSEARNNFVALPGVERELKDIVHVSETESGILDGIIKLNGDFTEDAAIRIWRAGDYPIVHLASHYSYDVAQPNRSFLLVGDGQLTFEEMQDKDNLFGKVDLLTLSACDTAMGAANGKEAEGLAYLAQNLGAKSVIASLWQISDAGTPEFMKHFYKNLKENPSLPKGEAFRMAQLALLRGNSKSGESSESQPATIAGENGRPVRFIRDPSAPFTHPYYWSPFVLIGNWR